MSETDAKSPDEPPDPSSGAMPASDMPVGEETCSARADAGKTMTVFGALFGAAAAVPT